MRSARTPGRALLVATMLIAGTAASDAYTPEIEHLLAFVAQSDCVFIRNGSEHSAKSARDHMELKLSHGSGMITTGEQFIEYVGTGSSLTGREYRVRCDGREQTSAAWLEAELQDYRKADGRD